MQSTREWPGATAAGTATTPDRPTRAAALLQVLAIGGYGVWM